MNHAIRRLTGGWLALVAILQIAHQLNAAEPLPSFDFSQEREVSQWHAQHDIGSLSPSQEGMVIQITGSDPYLVGPARDYPADESLWLNIRLKSDQAGSAQIFYFQTAPDEGKSIRFGVAGGDWQELRVPFPALGRSIHLRIDPAGTGGRCVIQSLRFELRPTLTEPAWPTPTPASLGAGALHVRSGDLELAHSRTQFGGVEVSAAGKSVAIGNGRSMLGYRSGGQSRWIELNQPARATQSGKAVQVELQLTDPDGARWTALQTFRPGSAPGRIDVESQVMVDQDRSVIFFPLLTCLPGVGSFGEHKAQGLLAGVEYLEDEPSSSEKDLHGPQARRKVPDSLKLTFPLMAISAADRYLGILWDQQPDVAAVHDSPDRTFHSGGHLMALIFPGSASTTREDGSLLPYDGQLLRAGQALRLRATLVGGRGSNVIASVQHYVSQKGLPALPRTGYEPQEFYRLEAHGWLDSQIRDGSRFRHAVGGTFGSNPSSDAALFSLWLAGNVEDADLSGRLTRLSAEALHEVKPANYNGALIGHIRLPAEALVFGSVAENVKTALAEGRGQVRLFQPDGSMPFTPAATGLDLGSTHHSKEANGLASPHVVGVLERAAISGDPGLRLEGLRLLRALGRFQNGVPRGAQTWEVPLHTPDILASAYLVRAYTLGYELTSEPEFLSQARYWAWTGVPFIYLTPPTQKPVGIYSTIPVLGATMFVAPNWIGLPVQWCGLVYGDAIRRFARHDPSGPWIRLADGIAAAGMQHIHTAAEPNHQGLLPDSFDLRNQLRNPVPINPATLMPEAMQLLGKPPVYDFQPFRKHQVWVHAPGRIERATETGDSIRFKVSGWPSSPWNVLLSNVRREPLLMIDGKRASLGAPHEYRAKEGLLILQLTKPASIELRITAE